MRRIRGGRKTRGGRVEHPLPAADGRRASRETPTSNNRDDTLPHPPDDSETNKAAAAPQHEATVVIVGGGPHALAVLSALHERSLAYMQLFSDPHGASGILSGVRKLSGLDLPEKVGSVIVVDPGATFLEHWNARFAALEIKHLRSPAFAHPRAYEPQALVNFAVEHGRTNELLDTPFVTKRLAPVAGNMQEPLLYSLPTTALFADFCASLGEELPHQWVRGKVVEVLKDGASDKFCVRFSRGNGGGGGGIGEVRADAVVLATGPTGPRNIPTPFRPHVAPSARGSGLVTHTEDYLGNGHTVASMVSQLADGLADGGRLLVIGGGLTAAQTALAAVAAGARVVMRSRRPLTTRAYDLDKSWLDLRHSERLRASFLSTPVEGRLSFLKAAAPGGSIPGAYMERLRRLAGASDRLELQVSETIDASLVCVVAGDDDEKRASLSVDGELFDHVILATGVSTAPALTPLFQQLERQFGLRVGSRLPLLDEDLRWMAGENVFVVGANAALELGPGALNLMGAMRGAKIVAEALREVMWSRGSSAKGQGSVVGGDIFGSNQFSALELDDISGSDSSDEESVVGDYEAASLSQPVGVLQPELSISFVHV